MIEYNPETASPISMSRSPEFYRNFDEVRRALTNIDAPVSVETQKKAIALVDKSISDILTPMAEQKKKLLITSPKSAEIIDWVNLISPAAFFKSVSPTTKKNVTVLNKDLAYNIRNVLNKIIDSNSFDPRLKNTVIALRKEINRLADIYTRGAV